MFTRDIRALPDDYNTLGFTEFDKTLQYSSIQDHSNT